MAELVKSFSIEILVNNSGGPAGGPITAASTDQFTQTFNRHLICNHIISTAVIPAMKAAGYGRIINVISTSVKIPLPNLGVSNTIRGAVASWAKTMANELGMFQITVNNVLPGATLTQRLESILESAICSQRCCCRKDCRRDATGNSTPPFCGSFRDRPGDCFPRLSCRILRFGNQYSGRRRKNRQHLNSAP